MAIEITMPKLSDTMEEGKILKWLIDEGDTVNSGDIIAEIETDKADMEYEVIEDGVLLKIIKPEGSSAPVGELIALIGEEGEDVSGYEDGGGKQEDTEGKEEEPDTKEKEDDEPEEEETEESSEEVEEEEKEEEEDSGEEKQEEDKEEEDKEEKEEEEEDEADVEEDIRKAKRMAMVQEVPGDIDKATKTTPTPLSSQEGGVKASPVARRLADENGIDIGSIEGSGPDGRVVKKDIEAAMSGKAPARKKPESAAPAKEKQKESAPKPEPVTIKPPQKLEERREAMSGMRKTIAKRLVQSKVEVPHFYLTIEVDTENLVAARESVKQQDGYTISVNDFIVKACAAALLRHPMVNARIDEDEIVYNDTVDIGVAVAIDEGLITPYVRRAHEKGIGTIAQEVKELAGRARNRKLKPEEYSGGSMTISNLGMFGIDAFTAIINPPESTILAVGRSKEVPIVKDGELTTGHRMMLTLSCDHRIVDGAVGARFLETLKSILENPMQMLV